MRNLKIKDRIILGSLAGLVGVFPWRMLNTLEFHLGFTGFRYGQLAAELFTPAPNVIRRRMVLKKKETVLSGRIANQVLLAATGVGITYTLSATGRDYAPIKGAGLTALQ